MSKNPNRRVGLGKETMTRSLRWERDAANLHVPKRRTGQRPIDGEGSSEPTKSQVDGPTQYLNYQDQLHDITNCGYDAQQYEEAVEGHNIGHVEADALADEDDDYDEATPHPFATEGPPFPRGPNDLSVLSSYTTHVAVSMWYNANNVSVFM